MPAGAITLKNFVGKDRYLRYDLNAFADIERETGKSLQEFLGDGKSVGIDALRLLLWAGLKWSDKRMDIETAGNVLEAYIAEGSDLEELGEYIREAVEKSGIVRGLSEVPGAPEVPPVDPPEEDTPAPRKKKRKKRSRSEEGAEEGES